MTYVLDGTEEVIQLPDSLTGAVFGPDVERTYVGTREKLIDKIAELNLDARGVRYRLESNGGSPLWQLLLTMNGGEVDQPISENPINIVWRLTNEFAEVDYRKTGPIQKDLDDLTSEQRIELNRYLENLLGGTLADPPAWMTDPSHVRVAEVTKRFERGKSTTHVHYPVLVRDATFQKGAQYRAKINNINVRGTSAEIIALYPGEIPLQFRQRMPTNGFWKVTKNDWEIDLGTGHGQETVMFVWDIWHDIIDTVDMVMPDPEPTV